MSAKKEKGAGHVISVMMAIVLIGKALGLVREILTGAALGAYGEGAAFNLASAIPRNFLDIAFASAISGCFIPVFNFTLEKRGRAAAYALADTFITAVLILSTALTLVMVVFSNPLAVLMGPGNPPETQALTGSLFKITLPIIIISAAAFSLIGILQSMGEFNIPAAMSIVSNGCIIIYCLFFAEIFGVYGLAAVFLIGWGLQILIQIPALKKIGYAFKPSFDFKNPAVREIGRLVLPVMISTWVMPVNNTVNLSVATRINEGASVAYSKADVLYSVITGVFVLSVANFIFPQLTKISARDDDAGFGKTLESVLRALFYFLIPMTVGLFFLSEPLCRIFFLAGRFDLFSVSQTSRALSYFSLGITGFGLQTILSRAFYARKNVKIPLLTGAAAVIANAALSLLLKDRLNVGGPALASSVSFSLTAVIMLIFMYRRNKYILNKRMLMDILLICVSAGAMALALAFTYHLLESVPGAGRLFDLIRTAASVVIGVSVYFICTWLLRLKEAGEAVRFVRGILKKDGRR